MKVEFLIQNDKENCISSKISQAFKENPKKAYFIFGTVKDTGFKIIEEELIDTKTKLYFYIGIDKKNTTKVMLDSLLKYSKEVYVYSNNEQIELNSNVIIFEYSDKAEVFSFAGNISESSLVDNILLYNKITYDLKNTEENKEYKKNIKEITNKFEEKFDTLDKEKIEKLVETKEIFSTRQYVHNVKSIAELLGNKESEDKKEEDITIPEIEIPKVDLSSIDFDIDIDIPEEVVEEEKNSDDILEEKKTDDSKIDIEIEEDAEDFSKEKIDQLEQYEDVIDKDNELYDKDMEDMGFDLDGTLDINDMLFSKSNIKLDVEEPEENEITDNTKNEDEILKVKKVNLNAITNFIYELPNKVSKGQELNSLKIPAYIQNMIPEFFDLAEKGKNTKINDADYKVRNINLEIVDVKNNEKHSDRDAKITQKNGQSFMLITTDKLKNINFEEKDIARIIKLSSDVYHIEIISKQMQEYKIWSKVCNQTFKSTDRHYGMM